MRNGIIVNIFMTRTVYALSKSHKPEVPLRPIVLFTSSPLTVYTLTFVGLNFCCFRGSAAIRDQCSGHLVHRGGVYNTDHYSGHLALAKVS